MVAHDIKAYLLAQSNKTHQLYIEGDALYFNRERIDDKSRSFCLIAKVHTGRFINSHQNIRFFISNPIDVKIFINRKELKREIQEISEIDKIIIDNIEFSINKTFSVTYGPLIKVRNLFIDIKGISILKEISFEASRGDFIVIMGPSGCGKTTLIKELAGQNNRKSGEIIVEEKSLYHNFHSKLKQRIGYVQQFDKLHNALTIEQVLYFTARIRRVTNWKTRIERVSTRLKLDKLKHKLIEPLSGGQKKRVAIATELLDQPDIILLDEPTSPLDPESVHEFLEYIKEIAAEQRKVVIMVTHKPSDLESANKVIFLSNGGYQIYFGPSGDFVPTIFSMIGKTEKKTKEESILEIYKTFSDRDTGKKFEMGKNKESSLKNRNTLKTIKDNGEKYEKKFSFFHQFAWLFLRYLNIKFPIGEFVKSSHIQPEKIHNLFTGAIKNIAIYLAQPMLVGLLFISFPFFNMTSLFLLSLAVIWFGVNNSSKEIVEELEIYKRERAYNLRIDAYLISKILLLLVIAAAQIIVLLSVVWLRFNFESRNGINIKVPIWMGLFLLLLSFSATTLGLLLSTIQKEVEKVLIWVPIVLMAQIVFAGLVSKPDKALKENISYWMIGRWGLEGLTRLQDTTAKPKDYYKTVKDWRTGKDTTLTIKTKRAIVIDKPLEPLDDTLSTDTLSALQTLGSYNNKLKRDRIPAWTAFNSLDANMYVILFHGLLYYFVCRLVLFKKDYIPFNSLLTPRKTAAYLHFILYLVISFIIVTPYLKNKIKNINREEIKKDLDDWNWYKDLQVKMKKDASKNKDTSEMNDTIVEDHKPPMNDTTKNKDGSVSEDTIKR